MSIIIEYACWLCGATDEETPLSVRLDIEYNYSSATCLDPVACEARSTAQLVEAYTSDESDHQCFTFSLCVRCTRWIDYGEALCEGCKADCAALDWRDAEAVTA